MLIYADGCGHISAKSSNCKASSLGFAESAAGYLQLNEKQGEW